MPVFQVIYSSPSGDHVTEYVCPDGYDKVNACGAFERQNPSANVVTVIIVPEEIPS
jgi:hypothetical protein